MRKRVNLLVIIPIIITISACFFWLAFKDKETVESITFFPFDKDAYYLDAKTTIQKPHIVGKQIFVPITTFSRLNEVAYLRQDITMLFANGILVDKKGEWKENTDQIKLEAELKSQDKQIIQAITFHHSEFHRGNDEITSSQQLSADTLYVIPSTNSKVLSFHQPTNEKEEAWKLQLDEEEKKLITSLVQKASQQNNLQLDHYQIIPPTQLIDYQNKPLPGFSQNQSDEVIGKLWEGVYKNYFLGIRKSDGEIVSPLGSTIPVILLAKDRSHLYVFFETSSNDIVYLKQLVSQ